MRRKVNRVGNSTLTVSLPSSWTKKHKISPGDELDAVETEKGIVFSTSRLTEKEKKAEIRFTKEEEMHIKSWISRLYRNGFTEIRFRLEDTSLLKEVKEGLSVCMGAELDDYSENKGIIKVFSRDEEIEYEKYIVRAIISYKCMVEQLEDDLEQGKFQSYEIINEYRKNGWKYRDYVIRQGIIKSENHEIFTPLVIFLYFLEKTGRSIARFYRVFVMEKKIINLGKAEKEYLSTLKECLDKTIKFITKKPLQEEETKLRKKIKDAQKNILHYEEADNKKSHALLTELFNIFDYLDGSISNLFIYIQEKHEHSNP